MGFIQRCMVILAIFLCYFHVRSESVDCEMYPFHHTCRGTMSRKRAMFPTMFSAGCDENKPSLNCIREFEERQRIPYIPLSKSRLLVALLNNNFQKEMARSTHHKQRNNEMDERTPPLMDSFLSELESSDNY
ncbi:uncharacterized protein LOC100874840 isoform X2 [Megachile rotundata]|nr:PREDICTED: uncharacterized protein LOC100874840 isoform X2 [Megachile rotundata]XP_012136587.1 PREDICTED: uncharacterized protein LOC100874840 isoform X2 [Megachile rotundata]XP_012136588.1 PREDICTED: uncharacterized protein LOC100874840 isoform X2 [Megachile rotundata]